MFGNTLVRPFRFSSGNPRRSTGNGIDEERHEWAGRLLTSGNMLVSSRGPRDTLGGRCSLTGIEPAAFLRLPPDTLEWLPRCAVRNSL